MLRYPRLATVRALRERQALCVLLEWHDESPDLSFEGAYYPSAVKSPVAKVQESTLLRDELTVWIGQPRSSGSQSSVLQGIKTNGYWMWRSQWQRDKDLKPSRDVQKQYGGAYVDMYPLVGNGAFAARSVDNTNTLADFTDPSVWVVEPAPDVYKPPTTRSLDGEGRWRNDNWRVQFRVPFTQLKEFGKRLELVLAIADGGLGERKAERAVSRAVRLNLGDSFTGKGAVTR